MFTLEKTTPIGRRGTLSLARGAVDTPFFMPVGTAGAMKGLTHEHLLDLGAQILLSNTYHLHLHPGEDVVAEAGGLHSFIGWGKPMLTDSGGFQVFSLRGISKIEEHGVRFQSHLNGDQHFIGPEESMRIQHKLGSDIIMAFDECSPSKSSRADIIKAVDRTLRWAQECKKWHDTLKGPHERLLFGIVQGGLEQDLRQKCAEELIAMDFDGYAIGGLAVGEEPADMFQVLDWVCPILPKEKLRYLMGVGVIEQLRTAVSKGIDMFDCVLPMRIARHGTILLSDGTDIRIQNAEFKHDHSVLDPDSPSLFGRTYKKSFVHHLFKMKERLADTIAGSQNVGVTLEAMRTLQKEIEAA